MKKISEMTEQEIRTLSESDIELMIKYALAEAGVKFVNKPEKPKLIEFPGPDKTIYQCGMLGNGIVFGSLPELQAVVDLLSRSTTKYKVDYDWNVRSNGDSYSYYINERNDFQNEVNITSKKAYREEVYETLKESIESNKKESSAYNKLKQEYDSSVNESKSIREEIWSRYHEVVSKYNELEQMCWRMRNDYMPLAENNESIALKFLTKAYSLTSEEIEYVTENYIEKQLEIPGV